jgi:hypothetical protein
LESDTILRQSTHWITKGDEGTDIELGGPAGVWAAVPLRDDRAAARAAL